MMLITFRNATEIHLTDLDSSLVYELRAKADAADQSKNWVPDVGDAKWTPDPTHPEPIFTVQNMPQDGTLSKNGPGKISLGPEHMTLDELIERVREHGIAYAAMKERVRSAESESLNMTLRAKHAESRLRKLETKLNTETKPTDAFKVHVANIMWASAKEVGANAGDAHNVATTYAARIAQELWDIAQGREPKPIYDGKPADSWSDDLGDYR